MKQEEVKYVTMGLDALKMANETYKLSLETAHANLKNLQESEQQLKAELKTLRESEKLLAAQLDEAAREKDVLWDQLEAGNVADANNQPSRKRAADKAQQTSKLRAKIDNPQPRKKSKPLEVGVSGTPTPDPVPSSSPGKPVELEDDDVIPIRFVAGEDGTKVQKEFRGAAIKGMTGEDLFNRMNEGGSLVDESTLQLVLDPKAWTGWEVLYFEWDGAAEYELGHPAFFKFKASEIVASCSAEPITVTVGMGDKKRGRYMMPHSVVDR